MSGPIVRTGTTPAFWNNWDSVFGKGAKAKKAEAAGKKTEPAPKAAAKKAEPAKKAAAKKAPKKS